MHEASMHDANQFITLTYDDQHLPHQAQLVYPHFQRFLKRYRKHHDIRYFAAGEYGGQLGRPHWHSLIFGHRFDDLVVYSNRKGHLLYTSKELSDLWPWGFSSIGELTFDSAQYVASYCTKKITGPIAQDHYTRVDATTGELYELTPEMGHMSRNIGIPWLKRWKQDVLVKGRCVINGHELTPPRAYDKLLSITDPERMEEIKFDRYKTAETMLKHATPQRLATREEVAKAKFNLKKRTLE